jgi:plastocyanin
MDRMGDHSARLRLLALRIIGAGLLAAAGGIHLDLYLTGYRSIPTIGWLFLLQVIAAFALALAVLVLSSPLAALAGAGFAATTLGGYLLSLWVGLFGFQEVRTTAGIVAGVIEIAAFAVLALLAVAEAGQAGAVTAGSAAAGRAVAGLSAVALVVLGISVAGAGAPAPGPATTAPSAGPSGPTVTIVISNFSFSPRMPRVSPGERIEVRNADSIAHTLSAGPAVGIASLFNTGTINPGQIRFLTAPGRAGGYAFYCKIHPFMTGLLVVGGGTPSAAALAALAALDASASVAPSGCGHPPGRRARRPVRLTLTPSL